MGKLALTEYAHAGCQWEETLRFPLNKPVFMSQTYRVRPKAKTYTQTVSTFLWKDVVVFWKKKQM